MKNKPTVENLIDLSERWFIRLEFSVENLLQVKKILSKHDISVKEYISFLSYMIEHNQSYPHIFDVVLEEIQALKAKDQLDIVAALKSSKENIFNVLKSHDAFKNRKGNLIINDSTNGNQNQKIINKNDSEEQPKDQQEYQKYLELLKKYQPEEDVE
jgi:hypothetical protein